MRRAFLTSRELFLARLGLPGTLLGVEVQHRDGAVRVLVEAPGHLGPPEGAVPVDEPLPPRLSPEEIDVRCRDAVMALSMLRSAVKAGEGPSERLEREFRTAVDGLHDIQRSAGR